MRGKGRRQMSVPLSARITLSPVSASFGDLAVGRSNESTRHCGRDDCRVDPSIEWFAANTHHGEAVLAFPGGRMHIQWANGLPLPADGDRPCGGRRITCGPWRRNVQCLGCLAFGMSVG
jgi:hypothetical protein